MSEHRLRVKLDKKNYDSSLKWKGMIFVLVFKLHGIPKANFTFLRFENLKKAIFGDHVSIL